MFNESFFYIATKNKNLFLVDISVKMYREMFIEDANKWILEELLFIKKGMHDTHYVFSSEIVRFSKFPPK